MKRDKKKFIVTKVYRIVGGACIVYMLYMVCTSNPPCLYLRSGRYNFIPRHVVDRKESERVSPKSMPANSASLVYASRKTSPITLFSRDVRFDGRLPSRHNPQAINTGGHQRVLPLVPFQRLPLSPSPSARRSNFFAAFLRLNTGKTCTNNSLALARWFRAEWAKLLISIQLRQAEEKMEMAEDLHFPINVVQVFLKIVRNFVDD